LVLVAQVGFERGVRVRELWLTRVENQQRKPGTKQKESERAAETGMRLMDWKLVPDRPTGGKERQLLVTSITAQLRLNSTGAVFS